VAISLNYLDTAQYSGTLTTAIRVSTSSLPLEIQNGAPTALLDVAGAVFNDQGKSVSSFNKRFTIRGKTDAANPKPPDHVFYNHFALVKPGIYQVRIAAIDVKQGVTGSAYQWIEIPDLQSKNLTLSSLIVGEKKTGNDVEFTDNSPKEPQSPDAIQQVALNVDHRFARSSYLRFLTIVYNAILSDQSTPATVPTAAQTPTQSKAPDLAVQVQVFRDNEPVITTPLHAIQTEGMPDMQRIPYAADVALNALSPGAYMLHVTVIDRRAKASATQRFSFQIE